MGGQPGLHTSTNELPLPTPHQSPAMALHGVRPSCPVRAQGPLLPLPPVAIGLLRAPARVSELKQWL